MAALTVSFTVLAVAWRNPRYDAATSGRLAPAWLAAVVDSPWFRGALRVVGLVVAAYAAMAAVLGEDLSTNPFGMFYVWWWVGLVPFSLLFGPVWKAISPVRTVNLALARPGATRAAAFEYPERLGYWPRRCGLYAFVWFELVYRNDRARPGAAVGATYFAIMLIGGACSATRSTPAPTRSRSTPAWSPSSPSGGGG